MDMDTLFSKCERQTALDLKINFKKFYETPSIAGKAAALTTLACAETTNCPELIQFATQEAKRLDASDDEISEAREIAAVMGIANNYYRFRHFAKKEAYQRPAGFRMSLMAKPVVGKLLMEQMALAVSIINGCETCVEGHEKSVLEHGGSEDQVHDLARLASTINGLTVLFRQLR
jgi:lipoyl-dependent peroxiredoxin subunit D